MIQRITHSSKQFNDHPPICWGRGGGVRGSIHNTVSINDYMHFVETFNIFTTYPLQLAF